MKARSQLSLVQTLCLALGAWSVNHFKELNTFDDFENLGAFKDGRALKHTLLGFGTADCVNKLRKQGFPADFAQLGELFETGEVMLDKHKELGDAFNVTQCNEFIYIPPGGTIEDADRVDTEDKIELYHWFFGHLQVPVNFENDLPFAVDLKWENGHQETTMLSLEPGNAMTIESYISHHWLVVRKHDNKKMLRIQIEDEKSYRLSEYISGEDTKQCKSEDVCNVPEDIVQINYKDMEIWRGREDMNWQRILRNENQPPSKKRFTELGFKKMKQPEALRRLLLDFYNRNLGTEVVEPWNKNDCHTNFYQHPSKMMYLTDDHKDQVFNILQPVLEEWAGGERLKPTSCYGIRIYYEGAWLREHVDTGNTHIISAIIQIAQEVNEDWHLSFIDHKGDRHYFTLAPGEMILYESATCIHGRPVAFNGSYFANTFVHYMPAAWK